MYRRGGGGLGINPKKTQFFLLLLLSKKIESLQFICVLHNVSLYISLTWCIISASFGTGTNSMSKDKILAIKNSLLISMEKVIFPSVTFSKPSSLKILVFSSVQKDFSHIILLVCQEVVKGWFFNPPPFFFKNTMCLKNITYMESPKKPPLLTLSKSEKSIKFKCSKSIWGQQMIPILTFSKFRGLRAIKKSPCTYT